MPWEYRASAGGAPWEVLLGAWYGLETSGPLWPLLGLLIVANVLQRGRFSLPWDPQCLPEGPSTPTEWLVTPVTDPWLCPDSHAEPRLGKDMVKEHPG